MRFANRKSKSVLATRRDNKGYLYVAPFALGFIFLVLFPMIQSFIYSFNDLLFDGQVHLNFSGLANYRRALFEDVEYRQLLLSAVRDMALSVPVILVFSMIVAVFLNKNFPGRAVFQIIFFIPVIVSSGIIPELFKNDLVRTAIVSAPTVSEEAVSSFDTSSMSALLISLNIPVALVNYIMQAIENILEIVNSSGIQILVFTMGLKSISPSLYEASSIEGATAWESFWKITLPMILPQFVVNLTYTVIDSFVNNNNKIMQSINVYNYSKFDFGYAASLAWMYFAIILVILGVFVELVNLFSRHYK